MSRELSARQIVGRAACVPLLATLLWLPLILGSCDDKPPPAPPTEEGTKYGPDGHRPETVSVPGALPNLVIVLVDTLRRDAVALEADDTGVMPHLADLAATGVAFSQAAAPASWTVPSIVSMLTGMLPHEHGCSSLHEAPRLSPTVTTYAEILRNGYGYETAVFTGAGWFRTDRSSILQGFERGDVGRGFGLQGTRPVLEAWAKQRAQSRPFCLVLHTIEAHDPYGQHNHPYPDIASQGPLVDSYDISAVVEPWQMTRLYMLDGVGREAMRNAFGNTYIDSVVDYSFDGYGREPRPELASELRNAYLDGATWVDGLLDQSMHAMSELGLLKNTLVVVTSDHGEAFGEDGLLGHGRSLHDAVIRVPLVMSGPGPFARPQVVTSSVGLIDVFPTFFDWAGIAQPAGQHGASLLPLLAGATEGRPVVSEEVLTPENTRPGMDRLRASVRDGHWKYVVEHDRTSGTIRESVFDLRADPEEKIDLFLRWPQGVFPWGDAFCEAVAGVRERMWNGIDACNALEASASTRAGGRVKAPRPKSCSAPSNS